MPERDHQALADAYFARGCRHVDSVTALLDRAATAPTEVERSMWLAQSRVLAAAARASFKRHDIHLDILTRSAHA